VKWRLQVFGLRPCL